MKRRYRGLNRTLAAAGGLLAAAVLPLAVAAADDWVFTPDASSLLPSELDGLPPLFNDVIGAEKWNLTDFIQGQSASSFLDPLTGVDHQLTFGSFTNDEFFNQAGEVDFFFPGDPRFDVPIGSEFDLMNFGGGFENAWMDILSGPNAGASDMLITPFGDFTLFGTGFSELAAALSN